ncbi:MAG: LapA family protein [Nitrospiria bacterium]
MIRLLFILIVFALLFAAGYTNQEQMITLHFFGGMETNPLKVYWIATVTFLIGFFFAALFFCPGWIRSVLARRKQSKRIEQLEMDLDRVRASSLKEEADPPSLARATPKEHKDPS